MNRYNLWKYTALLASIAIILVLAGCNQIFKRPKNQDESSPQQNQKKDPPKSLTKMEELTGKMIKDIEKVQNQRAQMLRENQDPSPSTENETSESNQNQDASQKEKGQQGQDSQQNSQEKQDNQGENQPPQKQSLPQVKWQDFEKDLETLHSEWNSYEPQARKDGALEEWIDGFEDQLDSLTDQIIAHNEAHTLTASNQLYQYFPKFLNLYKHQAPPETKTVIYYVRQILLAGKEDKWEDTIDLMNKLLSTWEIAKNRIIKPDHELNGKIDASIDDFSRAVYKKNLNLARIKGDILVKNIELIK